ncbi:hypothetical protein QBC44DRAFT_71356 [Cladorrhinum sp. PSN332]|nr:hypothetical protein QBC44DRAFT_71356 [Cladorrhinum sp. PSN332]
MGSHDIRSRWTIPLPLILLLWTTTASALSLSNFQLITSSAVPISCILAYNSQISGCVTNDFIKGNVCSSECVRGLQRVQSTLQSVCTDASVSGTSVLGQVLLGNLVGLLCPSAGNGGGGGATSTRRSTTSATLSTSTIRVVPTSTRLSLTFTTVRPTLTTTTSASSTTEAEAEETTSRSEEVAPTDVPTFVQSPAAPTSSVASSTSVAAPEQTTLPESGGGSPFDFSVQSSGALRREEVISGWLMGFAFLGMIMVLR